MEGYVIYEVLEEDTRGSPVQLDYYAAAETMTVVEQILLAAEAKTKREQP